MPTKTKPIRKSEPTFLSIPEEKAACIAAWKRHPKATHAMWGHHTVPLETVVGLRRALERIEYITDHKGRSEQAARFHYFRPVVAFPKAYRKAQVEVARLEKLSTASHREYDRISERHWHWLSKLGWCPKVEALWERRDVAYTARIEADAAVRVAERKAQRALTVEAVLAEHKKAWPKNWFGGRKVPTTH